MTDEILWGLVAVQLLCPLLTLYAKSSGRFRIAKIIVAVWVATPIAIMVARWPLLSDREFCFLVVVFLAVLPLATYPQVPQPPKCQSG